MNRRKLIETHGDSFGLVESEVKNIFKCVEKEIMIRKVEKIKIPQTSKDMVELMSGTCDV